MSPRSSFLDAESRLLARRLSQRGNPTLGDDADAALLAALAALPPSAHDVARASGLRIGRDVYSRRFFEDTLPGAVSVLSTALLSSGAGAFQLERAFHRTARLRFAPTSNLAQADPTIVESYLAGTLEGFFSAAFNCEAHAAPSSDGYHLELGQGRDVNVEARR